MAKAMFRHDIVLEGDKELIRKLKGFSKGFKKKALLDATMEGAQIIVREAKMRAPHRTGNLAQSIMAEPLKNTKKLAKVGISWRVKEGASGKGQASRHPAYYGIMVEKGSRGNRFRKKWRKKALLTGQAPTGTMPARPFLLPAFASKVGSATKKVKEELSAILRKEAMKKGG